VSVFDILKGHVAFNASYNSWERELEHATVCQEGTRKGVLERISTWSTAPDGYPICWLQGPAGTGKSTVAHTIAKQCDDVGMLAFSFFFSRAKQGRSVATHFLSTFAYQLAKSFPAVQAPMRQALVADPSIPSQSLRDQMIKLIICPILNIGGLTPPVVAVIDGLDECGEEVMLQELIQLLLNPTNQLPFRFLFSSRPETHIQQIFYSPWIQRRSYFLSLRDFSSLDDVRMFLQRRLSEVRERESQLMANVPRPWPSQRELQVIVKQSEGLFIYVSTLVNFVADKHGRPQDKLRAALAIHRGLDPLYDQVLSEAQKFEYFERVVGTIIYLREPLSVRGLGMLLQLHSTCIQLALRGCQSIFTIPITESDSVRPFHASLRDFLMDYNRAKGHFLNPIVHHGSILVDCFKSIGIYAENGASGGDHLAYACRSWCYHFSMVLGYQRTMGSDIVIFMEKMGSQWLKFWMYQLEGFHAVGIACDDCELALAKQKDMVSVFHHSIIKTYQSEGLIYTVEGN
jgi:hypothetical protein